MGSEYCPCGWCSGDKRAEYDGEPKSRIYSEVKEPESKEQGTNPKNITSALTRLANGNSEPHF